MTDHHRIAMCSIIVIAILFSNGTAIAQPEEGSELDVFLQEILPFDEPLSIQVDGVSVSALPMRVRVANQASPLAYSLDFRRQPEYGQTWNSVNGSGEQSSLSRANIRSLAGAMLIARGGSPSGAEPVGAESDVEYAARQVAIWSLSSLLKIDSSSVPNEALRSRATEWVAFVDAARDRVVVPLQPGSYGVDLLIRDTTASEVSLGIALRLDPNTGLDLPAEVDLYLDGSRVAVRTAHRARVTQIDGGGYRADSPIPIKGGDNELAEVTMTRNTKVVDAEAVWVNVNLTPGLPLLSSDGGPPLVTAETSKVSLSASAELNPDSYTGPTQLVEKAGTAVLTWLPAPLTWVVLLSALYILSRVGRVIDFALGRVGSRGSGALDWLRRYRLEHKIKKYRDING